MEDVVKPHPLLAKPLFIFSLPEGLLNTLTVKSGAVPDTATVATEPAQENTVPDGTGCATCNIAAFTSVSDQRDHVRSDLHKFNLKRKLAGQKIVNSDEFDKMLDGMVIHYS